MKKLLFLSLIICTILLMFSGMAQTQQSLGDFIRGEEIRLTQGHPNATYINISEITDRNGEVVLSDLEMTKIGTVYNYTINGSVSEDWVLGKYLVRGYSDGSPFVFIYDFDLVRGGRWTFNLNDNNFIFGVIIFLLILLGLILFKQYLISGAVVVILGFLLLFNEIAWWIAVSVIIVGVGLVAKDGTKE